MDAHYKLEQFHCHWGVSDNEGSEHTVQGQKFAGEVIMQIITHYEKIMHMFAF